MGTWAKQIGFFLISEYFRIFFYLSISSNSEDTTGSSSFVGYCLCRTFLWGDSVFVNSGILTHSSKAVGGAGGPEEEDDLVV